MSSALNSAKEVLIKTNKALMKRYMEEKVEPLIGIVEPSMYAGRFDWSDDHSHVPSDVRPYCKEIIMNLIAVRAEVALVPLTLISNQIESLKKKIINKEMEFF